MNKHKGLFALYRDGFRNMTWGWPLVWLIILKLIILFAILLVFFFKPAMAGMSEEQLIILLHPTCKVLLQSGTAVPASSPSL